MSKNDRRVYSRAKEILPVDLFLRHDLQEDIGRAWGED